MFDDIIKSAKENAKANSIDNDDGTISNDRIRISVIGVGGGGCNTVNRIASMNLKSAKTIAINTDKSHLDIIRSDSKVLIGANTTRGLGAGGFPEVGMKAAQMSKSVLNEAIGENELVFLTAGMGGGTGTGAAPEVAKIAKNNGAVVVAIVTFPFKLERARIKKAQWGLKQLTKECDTVIIIDNNRLVSFAPNLPVNKAFELADRITAHAVKGIADTIMFPSLMNIDYADVKSVMENGGLAMISIGEGSGPNRLDEAVKDALNHPLLDVDYEGAKGALIHVGGDRGLTLGEGISIGEKLTFSFDDNASVKIGARLSEEHAGKVMVTMITTGIKSPQIMGDVETENIGSGMSTPYEAGSNKMAVGEMQDMFYL